MATAALNLDSGDPNDVTIDLEETSQHTEDDATNPLQSAMDADENIDYVLVYERCQEEEKRDESREKAETRQKMRDEFEESLKIAGLELTKLEPEKTKRELVSSRLSEKQTKTVDLSRVEGAICRSLFP